LLPESFPEAVGSAFPFSSSSPAMLASLPAAPKEARPSPLAPISTLPLSINGKIIPDRLQSLADLMSIQSLLKLQDSRTLYKSLVQLRKLSLPKSQMLESVFLELVDAFLIRPDNVGMKLSFAAHAFM